MQQRFHSPIGCSAVTNWIQIEPGTADVRITENFGFQLLVYALFSFGCENSHHQEMRMCSFPGKCSLLGVEKSVNDNRVPLSLGSA
jgi:hypothetical protein